MKSIDNKFGSGVIFDILDVEPPVYVECTACMSVWSDFLSWANYNNNKSSLTTNICEAKSIIVLGCQVTDLAILNDIRKAKELHEKTDKDIYMGGCLALRFDIDLPEYIKRLDTVREPCVNIKDTTCIIFSKPFWIKGEIDKNNELSQGNLFRNMYPLKIGAGCNRSCKYCTIKDTRGDYYAKEAYLQEEEFIKHDDVVLISDSPLESQIKDWCRISEKHEKQISFRNVEPQTAILCKKELLSLSEKGLLKIFHSPIQSNNKYILKKMGRDYKTTKKYIKFAKLLRKNGVIVATNIIIDYKIDGVVHHNMDKDWMDRNFDYWVWNPYFDGKWDLELSLKRFERYLG